MTQQQDPTISISVPLSLVNYLLNVLGDRPFNESAPVIKVLTEQAQGALNPPLPAIDEDVLV